MKVTGRPEGPTGPSTPGGPGAPGISLGFMSFTYTLNIVSLQPHDGDEAVLCQPVPGGPGGPGGPRTVIPGGP